MTTDKKANNNESLPSTTDKLAQQKEHMDKLVQAQQMGDKLRKEQANKPKEMKHIPGVTDVPWQHDDPQGEYYVDLGDPMIVDQWKVSVVEDDPTHVGKYQLFHHVYRFRQAEKRRLDAEIKRLDAREKELKGLAKKAERNTATAFAQMKNPDEFGNVSEDRNARRDRKQKQYKKSQDKANKKATFDGFSDEDIEKAVETVDEEAKSLKVLLDYWEDGLAVYDSALRGQLEIVYTNDTDFAGLDFGFAVPYPNIRGITPPKDFTMYRSAGLGRRLLEPLNSLSKQAREFWLGAFCGEGSYKTTIGRFMRVCPDVRTSKTVSVLGNSGAWKVTPCLSWFKPELREIDVVKDLLAIFPEAEAKSILLQIGRTAAGNPKAMLGIDGKIVPSPVIEKQLEFKYRMAAILNGAPGVGKSTLMEYLLSGFCTAGYTYGMLPSASFNQFGWDICARDVIFSDDLTPGSLQKLMGSEQIKSIVSNGLVSTERKGVDALPMHSKAALFVLCNDPHVENKIDAGVLDRMHFLQTHSKTAVEGLSSDAESTKLTYQYWNYLAHKYDVDVRALALYVIRTGLDMFLDSIGYKQETDANGKPILTEVKNAIGIRKDTLQDILTANRENYQFQLPPDLTEVLTVSCRKAFVLAQHLNPNLAVPEEYDEGFHIYMIAHLAAVLENIQSLIQQSTKWGLTDNISTLESLKRWIIKDKLILLTTFQDFKINLDNRVRSGSGSNKLTLDQLWAEHIKQIYTIAGYTLEESRVKYNSGFRAAKRDADGYAVQLKGILKDMPSSLNGMINELAVQPFWLSSIKDR